MSQLSQTQIQNYTLISKVGEGASAEVILAKQNQTKTLCVLKMISKSNMFHQDDETRVIQQSKALQDLHHPFLVKMYQAFQTRKHFCLAMQYCPGGDLYTHIHMSQRFTEEKISLYAAQLVLSMEYLHSQNIIFRDLKPQNILIDKDGYLKIIDFGMSKENATSDDFRTFSVCGTSEYTAPEILERQGHGKSFDWWTLGCTLYEMLYKISPYYSDDRSEMFEKILNDDPVFDQEISSQLREIIMGLLQKDPESRLEFAKNIKTHQFFDGVDFQKLLLKETQMPYIPEYTRGKKMLKIVKDEIETFLDFEECETPKSTYVSGFDYNCSEEEESTAETQNQKEDFEESTQKTVEKVSTEDDEQQRDFEGLKFQAEVKKYKSLWGAF